MLFGKKNDNEVNEEKVLVDYESKLYNSLVYARLNYDLSIAKGKIEKNGPLDENTDKKIKNFMNKNIVNPFRENIKSNYEEIKERIEERIKEFKENKKQEDYSFGDDLTVLNNEMNKFFYNDSKGIGRICFGLKFIFDESIEYEYEEESLKFISSVIFNDENRIDEIYEKLKNNYLAINKKEFSTNQKVVMGILGGTTLILTAAAVGIAGGSLFSANVAQCVCNLANVGTGGAMVVAGETAKIAGFACLSTYVVNAGMKTYNQIDIYKNFKEDFKDMKASEMSQILAMRVTLYELVNARMNDKERKEYINDILVLSDNFRSDAEYLYIIEKVNMNESKAKINACNNLTKRMATILGL